MKKKLIFILLISLLFMIGTSVSWASFEDNETLEPDRCEYCGTEGCDGYDCLSSSDYCSAGTARCDGSRCSTCGACTGCESCNYCSEGTHGCDGSECELHVCGKCGYRDCKCCDDCGDYPCTCHTHSYSTVEEPTCTSSGYERCSCGDTNTLPALGHDYCGECGECERCEGCDCCDKCGKYPCECHTHSYSTVDPTCTSGGYDYCSCGATKNYTSATGHSMAYSSPTCEYAGYYYCTNSDCNETSSGAPALGHDPCDICGTCERCSSCNCCSNCGYEECQCCEDCGNYPCTCIPTCYCDSCDNEVDNDGDFCGNPCSARSCCPNYCSTHGGHEYSCKLYTLTYNANNGSGAPSQQSKRSKTGSASFTVSSTTPTRTGYRFLGWADSSSASSAQYSAGVSIKLTSTTKTIYAVWQKATFTVTLNNQSATTAGTTSVTATYGSAMPAITKPARTYKVTYNYNGSGASNTSDNGTYTFGGYYTSADGSGTQYYTAAGASARAWDKMSTATLYAKWTGGSVTLPTPSRTGYTFGGWYKEAACTNKIGAGGASYTPTVAITLYAKWTANGYTVAYNSNKPSGATASVTGTMANSSYTYDKAQALRSNAFGITGWTFNGWNTKADGSGTSYANGASVKNLTATSGATVTLYAKWTANKYTVTLNNQSATTAGTASVSATYDSAMPSITKPARTYKVTYNYNGSGASNTSDNGTYTFGGYYTLADGSGTQYYTAAGASARKWDKTAATTLYAKWTGGSVTLPTPTRTGYTFGGWYKEAACTNKVGAGGASYAPTSVITLYAKWTANKYTVTLNNQSATTAGTGSVSATYDSAMPSITKPEKKYTITYNYNGGSGSPASATATHVFNGYYTATGGGGTQYYTAAGASARTWDKTSATTLYASWTPTSVTLPATPTRERYKFLGWADSSSATTAQYNGGASLTLTANKTIYAVWEQVICECWTKLCTTCKGCYMCGTCKCIVGLTYNFGDGYITQNISAGEEVVLKATVKSGYTFKNWTVERGDLTITDTSSTITFKVPSGGATIRANYN